THIVVFNLCRDGERHPLAVRRNLNIAYRFDLVVILNLQSATLAKSQASDQQENKSELDEILHASSKVTPLKTDPRIQHNDSTGIAAVHIRGTRNASKICVVNVGVWTAPSWFVQYVNRVDPEFKFLSFANPHALHEIHVESKRRRTLHHAITESTSF